MSISNKKIKNIKNEKYCTYSYIHALTHFLQDLFLKNFIRVPPCTVKVFTSLKNRKTSENKNFLEIKYEIK